jgi:hypothetical protein
VARLGAERLRGRRSALGARQERAPRTGAWDSTARGCSVRVAAGVAAFEGNPERRSIASLCSRCCRSSADEYAGCGETDDGGEDPGGGLDCGVMLGDSGCEGRDEEKQSDPEGGAKLG